MDHRDSFGKTLFGVVNDRPDTEQAAAMRSAKQLIFQGLRAAAGQLTTGRAGVLVDEQYGKAVIDSAADQASLVLAVPVEASGHEWFTLAFGEEWLDHVERIRPDYAKVLIRDNPDFDPDSRRKQLSDLAMVSEGLRRIDVPLLYELLVPATSAQLGSLGGDTDRYDRDLRPALVARVIADNQAHEVRPALWKVEGLDTTEGAELVADQATAGGHIADLIVLGRDAPADRLDHWIDIACRVQGFVGFAIGRSIWEDPIREYEASDRGAAAADEARGRIVARYLGFVEHWQH